MLTLAGFELTPLGLNSSTGKVVDSYPNGVSSNPTQVNIFQLTLAMSDYHEKFLFMYNLSLRMILK